MFNRLKRTLSVTNDSHQHVYRTIEGAGAGTEHGELNILRCTQCGEVAYHDEDNNVEYTYKD